MYTGQEVRPVRDDIGFCWQRPQMKRLMDLLAASERQEFPVRDMVAGISPHDDYLYAGRVYYPLFKKLNEGSGDLRRHPWRGTQGDRRPAKYSAAR